MKTRLLSLGACAFFAAAAIAPATRAPEPSAETAVRADELSAAGRQRARYARRHVRSYAAPYYVVPRFGRYGDPSIGPDGRPYQRPAHLGYCVIDEGYGRFSACSNR